MRESTKKTLKLDGLHCANCAAKIETNISKLDQVTNASINFVTKILTIEIANSEKADDILLKSKEIISKLESDVTALEVPVAPTHNKVLMLKGLDCPNCAAKIENEVQNIPGIKAASLDFVSGKLVLEISNIHEYQAIIKKIGSIANRLEPGIDVIEDTKIPPALDDDEGLDKKKLLRFIIGTLLFGTAVIFHFPFRIELSIFLISYVLVGGDVIVRALKNISKGQLFDENFLMSIATVGAFAIQEFPEGVAVMLFYQVGELFQDSAVNRSRKSIRALLNIRPDYANLKTASEIKKVSPDEVQVGDTIIIKPGEKVPLDGIVREGTSMLDTSALTGEPVPRKAEAGSTVLSGFVNNNGLLTVEVTKTFSDSTVSKILDLVQNASSKKAATEQFITKFARYYTPIVVIVALMLAVLPPLLLSNATFSQWVYRGLIFLVVSCPCALVISIPLGYFGGIGGASRNGILIKGSNYLEALNNIDTIVFDKTGTLTKGIFKVYGINPQGKFTKDELLMFAAYAESFSTHPIATSIMKAYGKEVEKAMIEDFNEVSGLGISATVSGRSILAGSERLMKARNISCCSINALGTVVHIAVDGHYAGYIIISDEIKPDSRLAIQNLKSMGVRKLVMLTGDNKKTGEKTGEELGVDEAYTELLPHQKVEKLELLEKAKPPHKKILFVGDGINDAPVLARADIGVAMGGLGSDAAIEAADIVLMTDEPSKLVSAIKIARRTRMIVWQNIVFALGVKVIVLLLTAGGLSTMWEAVFADVGVAVLAVINAMRVMKVPHL